MRVWLLCFAFSIFVFTALATLPLRQGEYPKGEGVDETHSPLCFLRGNPSTPSASLPSGPASHWVVLPSEGTE